MEKVDAWMLTESLRLQHGQTDPFSAAMRSSRMPMVITDPFLPDNPIIFANDAFLKLTGYSRAEVNGRNCRFLQGPETDRDAVAKIKAAVAKNLDIAVDILNYKKDGTQFWNSLYLSPVPDEKGIPQYFFASQFDVTERKKYELDKIAENENLEFLVKSRTKELEDALQTSKVLMHEVDHRVKNNLQMVSAMLMLQSLSIPDENIKNTLEEMLGRIDAMGLVHKRLYQSEDVMDFDLSEFTREIAENLVAASGRDDVKLVVDVESVTIKADAAASIALVVNETITNAIKSALPLGKPGELYVSVKSMGEACEISIRDKGPGMPPGGPRKIGFGTTLTETLIKQLKAKIEWRACLPGTQVRITMPLS